MKVNKNKSKFSSALSYFVKKTTVGTLIGMVMLSSTLMVSPDLIAHANSSSGNDSSSNVVAYQQVADAVAKSPFKDVATNSYAFDAIVWGKNQGLINGYSDSKGKPNGKFGPNDNVTEAQFVKMVSNYLGLKDNAGNIAKNKNNGGHWSDGNYDAMAKHGVPLNGYFDNVIRNNPMKRGAVAQVLGYLLGESVNLNDSINFLLSTGVTSGQNPQYEGKDLNKFFGSTNNLTRGQVITFLYRMDSKNLNNLSSLADMTASDTNNLNAKAKEGYSYVDVAVGGNKNTNNTGNTTGNYDNFFGNSNTGGNTGGNTSENTSKSLSEYDKDVKSVIGNASYTAMSNAGMKATHSAIQSSGDILVSYSVNRSNGIVETINVYFNPSSNKLTSVTTDYISGTILNVVSNATGIARSKFNGTSSDKKLSTSKYEIFYYSGNMYGLIVK